MMASTLGPSPGFNACLTLNLFWDFEGLLKVNVRAVNALSASDVDVDLSDILQACQNYSDNLLDESGNTVRRSRNISPSLHREHVRVVEG